MSDIVNGIRTGSAPSELKITDIRFADIDAAPMHCILVKVFTNQGLVGFGEVRDFADRRYALLLKNQLLGENPCHVDKLFRKIKQFAGHSRFGGGVSGIELALWDLAGKAYGVPIYQMLGGRFREKVRMYCDTDVVGKHDGKAMGKALKQRLDKGFTLLKMDLGIDLLYDVPGALCGPLGLLDELKEAGFEGYMNRYGPIDERAVRREKNEVLALKHPFTGIQITEKGLDWLEQYLADVRGVIGTDVPLAIDHLGHIGVNECIKLGKRIEGYNVAWMEDAVPWQYTDQYVRLQQAVDIPICTGEDIYLKEGFLPLIQSGGVSVVHPDILTAGGILETKKIADMACEHGVAMAIHMAESPIACLAAAHVATATENFLGLEFHSNDVLWWDDLAVGTEKPLIQNGFITLGDKPGLGIDDLNDEVIRQHLHAYVQDVWGPTDEWNDGFTNDMTWS